MDFSFIDRILHPLFNKRLHWATIRKNLNPTEGRKHLIFAPFPPCGANIEEIIKYLKKILPV